jgi:hypothetical protein
MQRRRPRAVSFRLAPAVAWLLAVAPLLGAPPARADAFPADMAGLKAWAADTTAHALAAAQANPDAAAAGIREALNRSARLGALGLRELGPDWLRRFTFEVEFREDLQPRYDLVATQPLLRSWQRGDLLWLRGHLERDPGGPLAADLGLYYRPSLPGHELTLSLGGLFEDHGLLDYQRYGVSAGLQAHDLEASARLFDDVADAGAAAGGIADRPLDGYDVALAARLPRLPWAWLRARQRWQIAVDSPQVTTRDELSLQLRPFIPLELEAGISDDGARRDWFTRLRFKLQLGASG